MAVESRAIDALAPGMVLAAEVTDAGGNVLLAAGTTLTAPLIALLRRRGVAQVAVERRLSAEEAALARQRIEAGLAQRFAAADSPLLARLREAVWQYRLEALGDGGG